MSYRIKNELQSNREFQATYKGHDVHVKREPGYPRDGEAFYIYVRQLETSFGTAYDGWWGDADHTLEEAVEEALLGSCLISENQRKVGVFAS